MEAIQSSTLKTLTLPVPGMDEQQLGKLQKQKLGLMQDLLTGKAPVKVDGQTSATSEQALEQKVLARLGERTQAMEVDIDAI